MRREDMHKEVGHGSSGTNFTMTLCRLVSQLTKTRALLSPLLWQKKRSNFFEKNELVPIYIFDMMLAAVNYVCLTIYTYQSHSSFPYLIIIIRSSWIYILTSISQRNTHFIDPFNVSASIISLVLDITSSLFFLICHNECYTHLLHKGRCDSWWHFFPTKEAGLL